MSTRVDHPSTQGTLLSPCLNQMRFFSAFLALLLAGCTMTIRPPASPVDPVTVLVVDHGRHSSLVLPRADGGSVEYAYGEWEWFARARDPWYRVFPAMFWPSQGTLGRRFFDASPEQPMLASLIPSEARFLIAVERGKAAALLKRLNDRYDARSESELYNPLYGLAFVKDDRDYCCLNNCNHVLGRWLVEIGCEVSGSSCSAGFRVLDQAVESPLDRYSCSSSASSALRRSTPSRVSLSRSGSR